MRLKIYCALIGTIAILATGNISASSTLPVILKPATIHPDPLSTISARQFLALTPQKFQELTGKKMSLLQKIEFKMLQRHVKKMVRKGEVVSMADVIRHYDNDDDLMKVVGILLGAILGPIGVIIALLIKENGRKSGTAFRWSLIGLLIWLIWFLILVA